MSCAHHPSISLLEAFAKGELSACWSVPLAAHIEFCSKCRNLVHSLESALALSELEDDDFSQPEALDFDFDVDSIMSLPQQMKSPLHAQAPDSVVEVNGERIQVPRVIRQCYKDSLNWTPALNKLSFASLGAESESRLYLIYIAAGATVPQHSHRGNELTLVLDGQYTDAMGEYNTGDFVQLGSNHSHSPQTTADEGCLVVSMVDAPLHFTEGWSRLINPLSQLFFR
jgi:putative transcriptional regulator